MDITQWQLAAPHPDGATSDTAAPHLCCVVECRCGLAVIPCRLHQTFQTILQPHATTPSYAINDGPWPIHAFLMKQMKACPSSLGNLRVWRCTVYLYVVQTCTLKSVCSSDRGQKHAWHRATLDWLNDPQAHTFSSAAASRGAPPSCLFRFSAYVRWCLPLYAQ